MDCACTRLCGLLEVADAEEDAKDRVAKEDIFKMKLDMFEKDFVRNAERGVKSELRKSDDFFQLASIYFQMKAEASPADNEPS